ncbi:hypothetical protein GGTG_09376 [Gaeumannomyces tritici R3-111a-1]|uniref:Uncharacterized protein n=1 Tax=Gaeumannomyces tritici (strain R3-111a-1) TaxID=644352 RepID=J3P779_GAET3|nr:hypothetical protein GGTG_09376 [Gaeumannomyces tritici R3-111a-1]EJT72510.1 hypothetical protein GGTG_09376 [Gaeumannomyces tritici R3-111a-1]
MSGSVYYSANMTASGASSPRTPLSSPPSSPKPQLQRIRELQFSRSGPVTETWPQQQQQQRQPPALGRSRSASNENFFLPTRSSRMRESLDSQY